MYVCVNSSWIWNCQFNTVNWIFLSIKWVYTVLAWGIRWKFSNDNGNGHMMEWILCKRKSKIWWYMACVGAWMDEIYEWGFCKHGIRRCFFPFLFRFFLPDFWLALQFSAALGESAIISSLTFSFTRFSVGGFLCGCRCGWCGCWCCSCSSSRSSCCRRCRCFGTFWPLSSYIQHLSPGPIPRATRTVTHLLQNSTEQWGYIKHWHIEYGNFWERMLSCADSTDNDDDVIVACVLIGTAVAELLPFWCEKRIANNFWSHQRCLLLGFTFSYKRYFHLLCFCLTAIYNLFVETTVSLFMSGLFAYISFHFIL